jgi:TRAP-type C4-dicarboxylate transport system permease small subunit
MKHSHGKSGFTEMLRFLYKVEDSLLVGLLTAMLMLAVVQILARNLFQSGLVWGDVAVRIMVLWVGLIGAMVATRQNKHITIDILSRYLPPRFSRPINAILNLFSAMVCGTAAYFSFRFVRFEYIDGAAAFGSVPLWVAESVIPLALSVMALRYSFLFTGTLFQSDHRTHNPIA